MSTVTGYRIFSDTGATGPSVGDGISGGSQTTVFDPTEYAPLGDGVVDYPSTVGAVPGTFYFVGGSYYFVPDDPTGFPPNEAGTTQSYDPNITGTTGDDTLSGTSGDDVIYDTDSNLYTATGNDSITGGAGADTIIFGDGNDTVYGEDGNDEIGSWGTGGGNNLLDGGAGNDTIIGAGGDDTIYGGAGSDWLAGAKGNDTIYGGADDDQIWVTDDHDSVVVYGGEAGTDWDIIGFGTWAATQGVDVTFSGFEQGSYAFAGTATSGTFFEIEEVISTEFDDTVDASATNQDLLVYSLGGDDLVTGGSGDDRLFGQLGNDTLSGGAGNDEIYGEDDNDQLDGGDGNDSLDGGIGNDTLWAGDGDDTLYGGDGEDTLYAGAGNDTLLGGFNNDQFYVGDDDGTVTIDGGGWYDRVDFQNVSTSQGVTVTFTGNEAANFSFDGSATSGSFVEIENIETTDSADLVDLGANTGNMVVRTNAGDDTVLGADGDESIYGNAGSDDLRGGAGADYLSGGSDDDTLIGGTGDDTLFGGSGNDTYVFADGSGSDTITDFDLGDSDSDGFTNDQLDLSGLTDSGGDPVNLADVVVSDDGSGNAVLTFPNGEKITFVGIAPATMTNAQMWSMGVPCFTAGTLIRTPSGDVPIETLRAGDLVQTADNGPCPVLWIGQRQVTQAQLARDVRLRPVLIREGVLGNSRDLLVSRQHGMVIQDQRHNEALARAVHLARWGGPGFRVAHGIRHVTYVHILFERHQIVFANGALSESFYPGPQGLASLGPENRAALRAAFPELFHKSPRGSPYGDTARPFLTGQQVLRTARKGRQQHHKIKFPDQPARLWPDAACGVLTI